MEDRLSDASNRFVRPTDVIALALVASAGSALSYHLMGLRNRALLVIFVVTWLASAAKRLSEFRCRKYSPLKAYGETGSAGPAVIAGAGPWVVLVFSYNLYPASFVWLPGHLPVWLNVIGIVLALITLVRPPVLVSTNKPDSSDLFVPRLTVHAQILTLALLLMSGSLVIGLVLGVWLVMLYATQTNPFSGRPA